MPLQNHPEIHANILGKATAIYLSEFHLVSQKEN